ncbi:poly-beta-hydroxybutyrate polymerase [Sphingomonas dokdonensis]|uniref:Poly-beta-hydroxybutyrate polymerase n=2 Tax=Sphingomonas dokdonensis TaxID=344880 RepID=A0A245ZUK8_9SPHN|nr:alpha/beta fold hydrolase [Sphingomonas dokdonensis]OWK33429.1 poly-beta-hydroxybutyrate polymerase [Sphingomonas dokdonensis]
MLRSETAASELRRAQTLAGLRRYQEAPRVGRRMAKAARRQGRARLRDYGGAGRPVIFVPSLINPPFILDLMSNRSLVRWMAQQGFHVWLLDWGEPQPADRAMDVANHVAQLLLPLLRRFPQPPVLVGYCLGGILSIAAAAVSDCAGVATIASPWQFDGYGAARRDIGALWDAAKPACAELGLVPMEVLQTGFWRLDPARTIAKFEAFATMPDDAAAMFVAMEDWANGGAPLTYAAGAELFEGMLLANAPGEGRWQVAGRTIDPLALACPTIEFVSLNDRIVPAATAVGLADRRDLGAGHVGMIVGSRAQEQLWAPLRDWLAALP